MRLTTPPGWLGFDYTAFLIDPAFIGALVSWLGIHHAMAVPGVLLLALVPLAGIAMRERTTTMA